MDFSAAGIQTNFSTLDWVIVAVYLAGVVALGMWANRFISNMADYVVAGRSLRSSLAVASMIGSELGLVTIVYAAQKGFTGGFSAFHIGLAAGCVTLVVGLTGFIVVPLRELGVMTIPEFYERRFGRRVRILGGAVLALAGVLNMGLFLKAGSLFIAGLTGMTSPTEIKLLMSALLILVLAYTILGGMFSVVITDYLQFVVLSGGLLVACACAVSKLGWDHIVEGVIAHHGRAGYDPLDESGFGPAYVMWMIFTAGLVSCAVWQTAVMRACSADSSQTVKKIYIWSSLGFMIRFLIPNFLGICALVYLRDHPVLRELFLPPGGASTDMTLTATPVLLSQILPTGLIGLIGAGMLAAFMSTHDSYLLCWSAVLTQDVVAPLYGERLSTRARLRLTRCFIAAIGIFLLIWSLWYPLDQDMWDYMAVTGAIYFTGAFACLLCGLYWRRASAAGAVGALLCGFAALLGLKPVQGVLQLDLPAEIVGLGTAGGALLCMVLGSLMWPDRPERGDAP